jgi:hypothetical protein
MAGFAFHNQAYARGSAPIMRIARLCVRDAALVRRRVSSARLK